MGAHFGHLRRAHLAANLVERLEPRGQRKPVIGRDDELAVRRQLADAPRQQRLQTELGKHPERIHDVLNVLPQDLHPLTRTQVRHIRHPQRLGPSPAPV